MAELLDPLAIEDFSAGLVNRARETDMPPNSLRVASNIDVLDSGNLARRIGYAAVAAAPGGISAWSDPRLNFGLYASTAGNLVHVGPNGALTNLATVSDTHRMSYAAFNGAAYYSNGDSMSYVDAAGSLKLWGIDPPPAPVVVASSGGNLGIGSYQLAYTVIYNSTEESAPSNVTRVKILTADSKLTVGPVPNSADISAVILYCSALDCSGNGEELYYTDLLSPGAASHVLNQKPQDYRLRTLNKSRFPPCTKIASFGRWIVGLDGDLVRWTEADQASIYDPRYNFYRLDGDGTALCPVDDGMYIGTENRLHWLSGRNPAEWPKSVSRPIGVIPMYSAPRLPDDILKMEQPIPGPCSALVTREAQLCILRAGGFVQEVTGARLAMPDAERAEIHYHELAGRRKLIVQLHGIKGTSTWVTPTTAVI